MLLLPTYVVLYTSSGFYLSMPVEMDGFFVFVFEKRC